MGQGTPGGSNKLTTANSGEPSPQFNSRPGATRRMRNFMCVFFYIAFVMSGIVVVVVYVTIIIIIPAVAALYATALSQLFAPRCPSVCHSLTPGKCK